MNGVHNARTFRVENSLISRYDDFYRNEEGIVINNSHRHIFEKGTSPKKVIVLLHGTGGNEHDLLNIGRHIDSEASLLGVRGNVVEAGMPRYFKRLAEGVFDEEDLFLRAQELYDFLKDSLEHFAPERELVTVVGYSNGANIAATVMLKHRSIFDKVILFHAMVPYRNQDMQVLKESTIFVGAGKNDPIIPKNETEELIEVLRKQGASVTEKWYEFGHQLTMDEINDAREWYVSK